MNVHPRVATDALTSLRKILGLPDGTSVSSIVGAVEYDRGILTKLENTFESTGVDLVEEAGAIAGHIAGLRDGNKRREEVIASLEHDLNRYRRECNDLINESVALIEMLMEATGVSADAVRATMRSRIEGAHTP